VTSHPSVPARAGTSGPSPPAGGTTSSSGCSAGRTSRPSASRSASSASSPSWRPRWGWGLSAYPNGLPECAWTRRDEWIFALFYIQFSQAVVLLVITLLFQWIVRHQCDFTLDHTITPSHHSITLITTQAIERAKASGTAIRATETQVLVASIGNGMQVRGRGACGHLGVSGA